jgi:hypothetical protein
MEPKKLSVIGTCVSAAALRLPPASHFGGALSSHTKAPAATNSQATSDSVITVSAARST